MYFLKHETFFFDVETEPKKPLKKIWKQRKTRALGFLPYLFLSNNDVRKKKIREDKVSWSLVLLMKVYDVIVKRYRKRHQITIDVI